MTVFAPPTVAVLSTGNEVGGVGKATSCSSCTCTFSSLVLAMCQLVEPSTGVHLASGKIYDSNRHTLLAALSLHHCKGIDLGIAEDT